MITVRLDEVVDSDLRVIKKAAATPVMSTSAATMTASTMMRVRLPEEFGGGAPGDAYVGGASYGRVAGGPSDPDGRSAPPQF